MTDPVEQAKGFFEKTRSAFVFTRLLNIPFWAIFNMLSIILYKDLGATPLQITAIVALKPISSLFSPYWSLSIHQRQDRLVSNLVWANILKFLPFLFFPWIQNNWLFVLSFGFYMMLSRGVIPAWMEVIKLNIKGTSREKIFAFGSAIDYLGTAVLPLAFGWILDDYHNSWRWIFFWSSIIGILSTFLLFRIPITNINLPEQPPATPLWQQVIKPLQQSWDLLKKRPDFTRLQIGFMLGGSGLMIMQTTLPMFFVDVLHLSYTEILLAITVCKGIGFAITSPWWVKWFDKVNIFKLLSWVTLLAACFPLIILSAVSNILWLYAAYFVYGMMQAGSELSWHMSGPLFARDQDSTPYSTTNVLSVGIRGCVAPLLGNLIYIATNSVVVLGISFLFCMLATERLWRYGKDPVASKITG